MVFDKFDADQSGTVSTAEMGAITEELDLNMSKKQIRAIMFGVSRLHRSPSNENCPALLAVYCYWHNGDPLPCSCSQSDLDGTGEMEFDEFYQVRSDGS